MTPTQRDQDRICRKHAGRRRTLRLGVTMCLGLAAANAAAVTCTMSTPGIAFGGYDVYTAGVTNGNGTLTLRCSLDAGENGSTSVSYKISLSTGSSNSFVQRRMMSGSNALGYNLYTANTYSVVWGDGTGTTATLSGSLTLDNTNPSRSANKTVYGQIPALQDVAVASDYKDNVTVTVTY